jgi:hypothetical protein
LHPPPLLGRNCERRGFPANAAADPLGTLFRDFFQRDRDGNPKGIIVIDLEDFQ